MMVMIVIAMQKGETMRTALMAILLLVAVAGHAAAPTDKKASENRIAASKGGSAALAQCSSAEILDESTRGLWASRASHAEVDAAVSRVEEGCRKCMVREFQRRFPNDRDLRVALAELTPQEMEALDNMSEKEEQHFIKVVQDLRSLVPKCVMGMEPNLHREIDKSLGGR